MSELFAGLGLIYQEMEKDHEQKQTTLNLTKVDKRRRTRSSQRVSESVYVKATESY